VNELVSATAGCARPQSRRTRTRKVFLTSLYSGCSQGSRQRRIAGHEINGLTRLGAGLSPAPTAQQRHLPIYRNLTKVPVGTASKAVLSTEIYTFPGLIRDGRGVRFSSVAIRRAERCNGAGLADILLMPTAATVPNG